MRKTLYDRLQPDVKQKLIQNQMTYEFTVNKIIAALDSKYFWSDLTVGEVSNLIIFSDSSMANFNAYGDESLIEPQNNVI
tara:strand:- start:321 stop:560 length:240 start_codon:yes stop_codon:yes gene_type:complete